MRPAMAPYEPDHYRLLGVSTQADDRTLKDSYRRLSRVYHPDLQQGSAAATTRFQMIATAYNTLIDRGERERYDRLLLVSDPLRFVDDPRADRALDILDGVVGRIRRRRRRELPVVRRGRDLRVRKVIAFRLAALGGLTAVDVDYTTGCTTCDGAGTTQAERNPDCHICDGSGRLKVGIRRQMQSCAFCEGRGDVLLAPCETCEGAGEVQVRRSVDVQVPPRCRSGSLLRVRGAGELSSDGGPAGDLVVDVSVSPDPLLTIDGDDAVVVLPLTWVEAALGATVSVPTLQGPQTLKIPAGTPSGREFRVSGAGLPTTRGRGDMRYKIEIDVPRDLGDEQKKAISDLQTWLGADRFAQRKRFEEALARNGADTLPRDWSARETTSEPRDSDL